VEEVDWSACGAEATQGCGEGVRDMEIEAVLGSWAVGNGSLHARLSDAIRQAVERGSLVPGTRLPSERALARRLAVSRSTVVAAYDGLRADGLLESRQGSGTRVAGGSTNTPAVSPVDRHVVGSLYRALLEDKRDVLSLAYAIQPAHPRVAEAAADVITEHGSELFSHTGYAPRGLPELRAALAELHTREGMPTSSEQILVTTGAQQAINLAAVEFLAPGDALVVESPTFAGTLDNFRARGARLAPVPIDAEGVDARGVDELVDRLAPAAIYLMPSFHNPTGVLLSESRRRRLAEISASTRVPLIEDNALEHNRLDLVPPPPVAAFAPSDAPVLTVGSFSKLAWGGLRLGWMRGPESIVDRLARRKVITDLGTPLLDQAIGVRLLEHVDELRADRQSELRANLALVSTLLRERLPEWEWEVPQGGPSLWVRLPVGSASAFAQVALRHGVEVVDGDAMSPTGGHGDYLRFPFTGPAAVLEEIVDRLTEAWTAYRRSRATSDETAGVVV
jgi:DNA-binding transcriptional MocR family regulator